ncbi:MAG: hypothetical protein Q9220_003053 [cf. Caloplaca sp. 1 TL-2023]
MRNPGHRLKGELPCPSNWKACPFPFKRDYGRTARRMPSCTQLPDKWSTEMDEFICYSEAVGDVPARMLILSLKKKFPELNNYAISEQNIERRLYCLDRMDNNYFKRGAAISVQRLESAGFQLPEPNSGSSDEEFGTHEEPQKTSPSEPSTPKASAQAGAVRMVNDTGNKVEQLSTARYMGDRYANREDPFTTTHEHSIGAAPNTLKEQSYNPVRTTSREKPSLRLQISSNKQSSDYRAKDLAPAASLSRLQISDDTSVQLGRSGSANAKAYAMNASFSGNFDSREERGESSSANLDRDTSYGSPRTPHGRVRPVGSRSNIGSARRQNDENLPPGSPAAKTPVDTSPARRYGQVILDS